MAAYIFEWLQLILRCLHIITGIAWIGASFYFVWLDNHLFSPESQDLKEKGVDGELWAVHGGGFYNPQKYLIAPKSLPHDLHWFYWESYSTWLSGFALFVVVYLYNAKTMMLDARVSNINANQAIIISLAILAFGWIVYDTVCKKLQHNDRIVGLITSFLVVATSYGTCQLFAPRAAFLITGAMIATIMTANVFFVIIPGQRKVIQSMRAGEKVDPIHGKRGKQRSVHNTYFTLPVLFAMLSNHFYMIYSQKHEWLLLVLMMLSGVLIRQFFVLRHKNINQWGLPVAASAIVLGVAIYAAPNSSNADETSSGKSVSTREVSLVMTERCAQCHSSNPTLMPSAPKGLTLDTPESIEANASLIYLHVVQQKTMPAGNLTKMTDEERLVVKAWFESR